MQHVARALSQPQIVAKRLRLVSETNKKLSYRKQIARQLRISILYSNSVTLKSGLEITQSHWKWLHSINRIQVPISVP